MNGNFLLILPVLFPVVFGIIILKAPTFKTDRGALVTTTSVALVGSLILTFTAIFSGGSLNLWRFTDTVTIAFKVDSISILFSALMSIVWLLVGIYAFKYMTHEEHETDFFGWYLIVLGVLIGLDYSANLISFYIFYELMTLTSLPLVLHERTREAVMAGLKYLFYSIAGAFIALFGIFFLTVICSDLTFTAGGIITSSMIEGRKGLFLAVAFLMIIGFGTKAGMFPLHGWLPTAHPVAPAPASAVLSGVITKAGVLALIRVVYYIIGPDLLRGTWVQIAWMSLTLFTVFMGSMLAYREKVFKKRLAYSTVSQVSYILFGLSLMDPTAFVGALSHVVFHSVIKNALFMCAGTIIFTTGWTNVDQMGGLGKVMPKLLICYTGVSLALIGIPPFCGFVSKWYLASGALSSGTGAFTWLGPAILLISALLTAGYLLPIMIKGFFPGTDFDWTEIKERKLEGMEAPLQMLIPIAVLALASLILGLLPGPFINALYGIAGQLF